MVKCEEFYEKFRQLEKLAKEVKGYCQVDARESIRRFKQYSKFCERHDLTPIGAIPEYALRPLMTKKNKEIAPIVVEQLKKRMKSDNPEISRITTKVVMNEIGKVCSNGEPIPIPDGTFNVIYADPPWTYNVKHLRGSPENHYQTMTTNEICDLKVPSADDAVLFLWTTNPMLEDALRVMVSWGFKYKTNLVWIKNRMGVGFYFRGQHELLLLGVKGSARSPNESNRFSSVLKANIRQHSQKPEEIYKIIETMYPNAKYLELFARQERNNWFSWGNEV